ncbi:MAG: ABC transporter permease, partial [Acidimicrobiales bacterium]|nr:ABC transporter permease [Acidimicrobiales bacterium]
MFRLTLRNISRQKLRYALTTLAVVLGVAFLSTAFFLTDRIRDTFDELAVEITGDLDLEIRASVGDGERANRLPVPADLTRSITTDIPGVAAVEPRIRAFNVVPIYIDDEGEPAAVSSSGPKFGMNFSGDEMLSQLYIAEGRAPTRTGSLAEPDTVGEFVLDTKTASTFEFEVGEKYVVSATGGNREFSLVGLVYFGSPDENKSPGAIISAFDDATAQEFLGREGLYDTLAVSLTSDADEEAVMADIQQRLDAAMDVLRSELQALPAEQLAMLAPFAEAQIEVVTAAATTEEDRADFDQIVSVLSNV